MAQVKTAVSIDEDLFADAEAAARDLHLSRSRLFALALHEFLERRASRDMLDRLNAVHDAPLDAEDERMLQGMRARRRRIVDDQWT